MAKKTQQLTRIIYSDTYAKDANAEQAARNRLEAAIQRAMREYHDAGGMIDGIEMYPTD
ncbi:MAG: hypothetical protein WBD68_06985 [Candidatus Sulfotelmatobacter sp.]